MTPYSNNLYRAHVIRLYPKVPVKVDVLRRSFAERCDHLLEQERFMDAVAFTEQAGLNTSHELKQLQAGHQVLYVQLPTSTQYPVFQLNSEGAVYPALAHALPRLSQSRSGWDICFWLLEERTVLLRRARVDATRLSEVDLDEALELGALAGQQSDYVTARPLDLLRQNSEEAFEAMLEDWLSPDTRQIPRKYTK